MKIHIEGTLQEVHSVLGRLEGVEGISVSILEPAVLEPEVDINVFKHAVRVVKKPLTVAKKRKKMSAEARKKIADAQKARWAKVKKLA